MISNLPRCGGFHGQTSSQSYFLYFCDCRHGAAVRFKFGLTALVNPFKHRHDLQPFVTVISAASCILEFPSGAVQATNLIRLDGLFLRRCPNQQTSPTKRKRKKEEERGREREREKERERERKRNDQRKKGSPDEKAALLLASNLRVSRGLVGARLYVRLS